jgi:hypothetical protein
MTWKILWSNLLPVENYPELPHSVLNAEGCDATDDAMKGNSRLQQIPQYKK